MYGCQLFKNDINSVSLSVAIMVLGTPKFKITFDFSLIVVASVTNFVNSHCVVRTYLLSGQYLVVKDQPDQGIFCQMLHSQSLSPSWAFDLMEMIYFSGTAHKML